MTVSDDGSGDDEEEDVSHDVVLMMTEDHLVHWHRIGT